MRYPRRLTWRQAEILRATERFLVLVAGRRFGKTVLAVAWLVACVLAHHARTGQPGIAYYVLPFRHQAKKVAWDELKRATRALRAGKPNETELSVTLRDGGRIQLQGADDPESLEGVGLCAVVCDEFARMKFAAWEKSLRPALADHQGRALLIGKPRGHNHLKTVWEYGRGATKREGWRSWQFRTVDGGFVSQSDIDEARRDLPPRIFRQEYEASFETLAGRVYEEYSTEYAPQGHVLRATEVPEPSAFARGSIGVDWGFTHPFAAVGIGESGGRRVVTAEAFAAEFRIEQVEKALAALRDRCTGWSWYADPSRPDLIKHFSEKLRVNIEPADNDVDEGLLELMRDFHPRVSPTGEQLGPQLFVSDACPNVVAGLDRYVWATDREGNSKEKPEKVHDDAADATRYARRGLSVLDVGQVDDGWQDR